MHQIEILLKVLTLEARLIAAIIVGRQIFELLETSGEEPATQRAVRDESDAELSHGGQHVVLRVATPKRVLGLQRGDRMNLVGATNGFRCRFRETEVLDLARAN